MMTTRQRKCHSDQMTSHIMRKMEDIEFTTIFVEKHLYRSALWIKSTVFRILSREAMGFF